ncbi:hypothetical protein G5B39_13735 (plasmid) [Rhodobacteraceae bacterium SC52]|nr:hypothetical protein G5B39_13735 [Rhodobacteraceae bacterium SC52]
MPYDYNRRRDLPRAPQFPRIVKPKSDQVGDPIKRAKRRMRIEKALAKATRAHGFDTLFPVGKIMPEKSVQKERKLVIEALTLELHVHSQLLKFHGLVDEPNPSTAQYLVNDGEIPF